MVSFAYAPEWLHASGSFAIDPMLMPYEGDQYLAELPGILADAAPDRWGRILQEGFDSIRDAPWIVIAGGIPLIITTLGFTFLGEALRDWLDPRLRRVI